MNKGIVDVKYSYVLCSLHLRHQINRWFKYRGCCNSGYIYQCALLRASPCLYCVHVIPRMEKLYPLYKNHVLSEKLSWTSSYLKPLPPLCTHLSRCWCCSMIQTLLFVLEPATARDLNFFYFWNDKLPNCLSALYGKLFLRYQEVHNICMNIYEKMLHYKHVHFWVSAN